MSSRGHAFSCLSTSLLILAGGFQIITFSVAVPTVPLARSSIALVLKGEGGFTAKLYWATLVSSRAELTSKPCSLRSLCAAVDLFWFEAHTMAKRSFMVGLQGCKQALRHRGCAQLPRRSIQGVLHRSCSGLLRIARDCRGKSCAWIRRI